MSADEITMQISPAPAGWVAHYVRLPLPVAAINWTADQIANAKAVHVQLPIVAVLLQHELDGATPVASRTTFGVLDPTSDEVVPAAELDDWHESSTTDYLGTYGPNDPGPSAEQIEATGERLRHVAVSAAFRVRCEVAGLRSRGTKGLIELAGKSDLDQLGELYALAKISSGWWTDEVRAAFTAQRIELERGAAA